MDSSVMAARKVELSDLEEKISKCRILVDHPTPIEYKNLKYSLPCIDRIPCGIRERNPYSPSMVSIGLLHRGEKHLETMEDVKLRYMTRLLQRAQSDKWKELQNRCLNALSRLEHFAREYYATTTIIDGEACDKDILEMMLIDGCFIIELLIRFHLKEDDLILRNKMWSVAVSRDLLLLENQIPFFVLENLYKLTILERSNKDKVYPSLTRCIFSFFRYLIDLEEGETGKEDETTSTSENDDATTVCHILHLLHKRYLRSQVQKQQPTTYTQNKQTGTSCNCILQIRNCTLQISHKNNSGAKETWEDFKYSATELDMSGVKLEPGNGKNLFDVKFSTAHRSCFRLGRRPRFEIPPFCIYDNTEIFLRNTIAFEQSCADKNHYYFTSHALLMDKLINSAADVKLLEEKGIIRNNLPSRELVSTLFNNICKNISIDNFCFEEPFIQVNKYCKQRWPKISSKTET